MCVGLAKLFDDTVDKRGLGKGDGVGIAFDCDAEWKLRGAKVGDILQRLELIPESCVLLRGISHGENIIHMDSKNYGSLRGTADIDAPIAPSWNACEAPFNHSFVEGLVPTVANLAHSVNALHQAHDPLFLSRRLEPGGLFHIRGFIAGEDAMEESGFDVEVLNVPL